MLADADAGEFTRAGLLVNARLGKAQSLSQLTSVQQWLIG